MPTEEQRYTYRALLDHIERCEACNERLPCVTGAWLERTQRAAREL
jgi:hypothetical protein